MIRKYTLLLLLLALASTLTAQNLDNIEEKDPLKVSGSINATGIGYHVEGIEQRRNPFNWFLNGNINLVLYGWNVPFSFSYSDQDKTFRQPFNRFGVAPSYKWVKAYAGYQNLNYSSYTLAGHVFLGGAVELTPGKWRFSAMYGQLNKAIEEDTTREETVIPAYKRMGYGFKAGYGDQKGSIDLILFSAADDEHSLSHAPVKTEVLPEENLVISLVGRKQLTRRIGIAAEYASSAYTRDTRTAKVSSSKAEMAGKISGLFTPRVSSVYYDAMNANIFYTGNFYSLQLNYERIDPGYQTLGAYFFNNDLENVTVSGSLQLLQGKLNLSANAGVQKNNLDDTEVSSTRRVISAFNANYVPGQAWNISASYSNFTSYTNIRPRFDPFFQNELDTLNFYQVNRNATTTIAHNFGSKERKQSIMFNGSYQVVEEDTDGEQKNNDSNFYNGTVAYRLNLIPQGMSFSAGLNGYRSNLGDITSTTIGPNLSLTRAFFKKQLRNTLSGSYNHQETSGQDPGQVISVRLTSAFSPGKAEKHGSMPGTQSQDNGKVIGQGSHNFSLSLIYLKKMAGEESNNNFDEVTATLNYSYRF